MNIRPYFKLVVMSVVFIFSCKTKNEVNKTTVSNLSTTSSTTQKTNAPFEIKLDSTVKPTQSLSDPKPNTGAKPR